MANQHMSEGTQTRQDRAREELLQMLEACGFNGTQFLERAGLGLQARPTLFALMGYIAKAEGRVTSADVRYAEQAMKALGIGSTSPTRKRLVAEFTEGKSWRAPAASDLLRWRGKLQPSLPLRMLMLLTPLCYQDRRLSPGRIDRCEKAGEVLGLSQESIARIITRFRTKAWITHADAGPAGASNFTSACRILGGKGSDSLVTLKNCYRRKVRQYHPDKRQHEQHSAVSDAAARDHLLELQKAWEIVRKQHPDALR